MLQAKTTASRIGACAVAIVWSPTTRVAGVMAPSRVNVFSPGSVSLKRETGTRGIGTPTLGGPSPVASGTSKTTRISCRPAPARLMAKCPPCASTVAGRPSTVMSRRVTPAGIRGRRTAVSENSSTAKSARQVTLSPSRVPR